MNIHVIAGGTFKVTHGSVTDGLNWFYFIESDKKKTIFNDLIFLCLQIEVYR